MHCYVRGMNHNTAPVEVREQLAFQVDELARIFDAFSEGGVPEALVLTTCNRTEFYIAGGDSLSHSPVMSRVLQRFVDPEIVNDETYWYERRDEDAIGHLFRVASGLDSLVLGEPEILGQVKLSFDVARQCGAVGVFMSEVFHRCMHVVKRVRTDTAIGVGSISLASASSDMLARELGPLSSKRLVLIGTGEIAQQVVTYLGKASPLELTVVSRSQSRAERLAGEHGATPMTMSGIESLLARADGVVCATSSSAPVVDASMLAPIMAQRNHPIVLIDLAHPRNVDPDVRSLSDVRLYAMDDLRIVVDQNLDRRRAELPQAEAIIARETAQLATWHRSRPLMQTVKDFRAQFEEIRQEELKRLRSKLSDLEWDAADEASRRIVAKLLHRPTLALKAMDPNDPQDREKLELLAAVFGLSCHT